MMAAGKRPVPFRTRKLSPPAPMVLPPGGSGRVGYRRPNNFTHRHPPQDTTSCGGCLPFVLHASPVTAARAALWGLSSKKCVCYRRVGGVDVALLSRFPRDRTCSRYANGPTTGMNTRKSTIQTSDHRLLGCLKNTMILATNSTTAANVSSIKT